MYNLVLCSILEFHNIRKLTWNVTFVKTVMTEFWTPFSALKLYLFYSYKWYTTKIYMMFHVSWTSLIAQFLLAELITFGMRWNISWKQQCYVCCINSEINCHYAWELQPDVCDKLYIFLLLILQDKLPQFWCSYQIFASLKWVSYGNYCVFKAEALDLYTAIRFDVIHERIQPLFRRAIHFFLLQ